MKPKFVAIFVVSILVVSMVATTAAAVSQAVEGDSGSFGVAGSQYSVNDADGSRGSALSRSFKFVCPFH